jgi:hypothetical protein
MARCNLLPYPQCDASCKANGSERQPNGPQTLQMIANASCQQLAAMMQQIQQQPAQQPLPAPPQKPAGKQWQCNAQGTWQKCDASGFPCMPQYSNAIGFGGTEPLARAGAETQCNSAMNGLVSANFTYHALVISGCRATTCSPP